MATKQIYAAPEQYGIDTFIAKFPGGYDTIISALTVIAFEDYIKDLWDNNWSINTPNPNNWSLNNTIETYKKVLREFSGDPVYLLELNYDVQKNFVDHISLTKNADFTYSIWYSPALLNILPRTRAEAVAAGIVEITTSQWQLPRFFTGQTSTGAFAEFLASSPTNPYVPTYDGLYETWNYPLKSTIQGLIASCILLDLLPDEISTNIRALRIDATYTGITSSAIHGSIRPKSYIPTLAWNFRDSQLAPTLRGMRPLVRAMAIKRFQGAFFNIKTQSRYMTFAEQFISYDKLSNAPALPANTIYYSIAKDAPLTGLKNPDGSDMKVENAQIQYTVEFWSKIFSDAGFLPLLQGIAATYPTQIISQYDTKAQAAYNSVVANITRKHTFFTDTTLINYHFQTLLSQFNITMDSQRRIFVIFNRDALNEDVNVKLSIGTFWGNFLQALIMAVVAYFGMTLLAPAGAGPIPLPTEFIGPPPPPPVGLFDSIGSFFSNIGSGISSVLGPIASALPVIAPLLAAFGITPTPKPKGSPIAPVNNTCPQGYTLQNGQCIPDSTGGTKLADLFTPTNIMLMAGGGIVLGLLFMGDDDNKAYRAAKRAKSETAEIEEVKTNKPKIRYNKRRRR